jgi:hypothetical protein
MNFRGFTIRKARIYKAMSFPPQLWPVYNVGGSVPQLYHKVIRARLEGDYFVFLTVATK